MTEELQPSPEWPEEIQADFHENRHNGCVGQQLVSENERVRIWTIRLAPGERVSFHRHVLDYFWTALNDGKSRSHFHDGAVRETSYRAGDTKHFTFGEGEFMLHDLANIGDTEIAFTTVEFLDSANAPQTVPESVRRR
ncbi:hypothetical protein [Pseudosulfitobacter sp. RP-4]